MSEQGHEGKGNQSLATGVGNTGGDSETVGLWESPVEKPECGDCPTSDRQVSLGRSRDFSQIKKTRSIGMTDDHHELWRKAAHPKSRSHWLAEHLEENRERIEQKYHQDNPPPE